MKLLCLVIFVLLVKTSFAGDIDKLQTRADVLNFLVHKVSKKFKREDPLLDTAAKATDTARYGKNKFFKADIDNNHLTDLVINGTHLVVIMDKGKGHYEWHYLDTDQKDITLIAIDTVKAPSKIIVLQSTRRKQQYDTLVYAFYTFVEYNPAPATDFSFEKITFATNQCFGPCPIFEITINKDRSATYKAIQYNDEHGEFKGTIPAKQFDALIELLNYLQVDRLDSAYAIDWTDNQTATTQVFYNGRSKTISDYGEVGTYGLRKLYRKFFGWQKAIEWSE